MDFQGMAGLSLRCITGPGEDDPAQPSVHRQDEPARLFLGMVASQQSPLPGCAPAPDRAMPRNLVRNPDRRQIAGPVTARQLLSVAPIGLHPVASLNRHQSRRYHLALDSQFRQLPVEYMASRASFITGPQLFDRAKLLDQFAYRFRAVENRSKASDLANRRMWLWRWPG